jgi:hypothetical protein
LEPNALGGVGGMNLILASFMPVRTENHNLLGLFCHRDSPEIIITSPLPD